MGDRVLIQFKKGDEVSPVIYGHWAGEEAPKIINHLRDQMQDRPEDISYIAARCVQGVIGNDKGSTGVGMWNATAELTEKDGHGDGGVIVVELGQVWKAKRMASFYDADFPVHPAVEWSQEKRA